MKESHLGVIKSLQKKKGQITSSRVMKLLTFIKATEVNKLGSMIKESESA